MTKRRTNRETAHYENAIGATHHIDTECEDGIYQSRDAGMIARFARIMSTNRRVRKHLIALMRGNDGRDEEE